MSQMYSNNGPKKDTSSGNWKELLKEADKLYMESQYEEALVKYHRAKRTRPHSDAIRLGILRCEESLNKYLKRKKPATCKTDLSQNEDPNEDPDCTMSFSEWATSLVSSFKKTHGAYPTDEMKSDARHVRKLTHTKDYFSTLMTEMGRTNEQQMQHLISTEIKYLQHHFKFWTHQIPPDAAGQLLPKRPAEVQQPIKRELTTLENSVISNVLTVLKAFQAKEYKKVLNSGTSCVKLVEASTYLEMDNKDEILSNLHSAIGSAHFEQGHYDDALEWYKTDLGIAKKGSLPSSVSRALGNIGRVYAKVGKFEEAINIWEEKCPMCKTDAERAWLYHELGYCYMAQDDGERALYCADQSYDAAIKLEKSTWLQNSILLTAQALVMLGRLQDALFKFQKALHVSEREEERDEHATATLQKAMSSIKEMLLQSQTSQTQDKSQSPENNEAMPKVDDTSKGDQTFLNHSREPDHVPMCTKSSADEKPSDDSVTSSTRSQIVSVCGSTTFLKTVSTDRAEYSNHEDTTNEATGYREQYALVTEAPKEASATKKRNKNRSKTVSGKSTTGPPENASTQDVEASLIIINGSSDSVTESTKFNVKGLNGETTKKSTTSVRSKTTTQGRRPNSHQDLDSESVAKNTGQASKSGKSSGSAASQKSKRSVKDREVN